MTNSNIKCFYYLGIINVDETMKLDKSYNGVFTYLSLFYYRGGHTTDFFCNKRVSN